MIAYEIIAWLGKHVDRTANLCLDSRSIQEGDVFVACQGRKTHGQKFIQHAIEQGASAIIVEAEHDFSVEAVEVACLNVPGLSRILGSLAHHWYREPSHALTVIAVTGTNGKTTCVNWIAAALNSQGLPCGTIGTLGVICPDGHNQGGELTTPDVLSMHRNLAALRDAGALVVALEASSIGIEQGRLDHIKIEIAAFTNLTHDHLDYHETLENYKAAKFKLFKWPSLGAAVINIDDPAGIELLEQTPVIQPITYSAESQAEADVQATDIQASGYGLVFNLKTPRGSSQLLTRLVGMHNISNLLLVAGVLRQLGWGLARTVRVLANLIPVEGRLQTIEPINCGEAHALPMVVVDYSHTPDSLERALQALTKTASSRGGKLICVFGCGGERDKTKRPLMGEVAERLADTVIITSDNPRSEDPQSIMDAIASGMKRKVQQEPDRAYAILQAVWQASDKDVILFAGKGHEQTQEFADYSLAFDDREWACFALTWLRTRSLSTDTRTLIPGQWFLALEGEHFNGHDYLKAAKQAGACAAIVNQIDSGVELPQIALGNTRKALTTIAAAWRQCFDLPLIAVTGSNGKTTTKEMIACILREWQGDEGVLATQGNLNNDLGVPLTLLGLEHQHRVGVVELGMNHPNEINELAQLVRPSIALVNNAQREHQEFMHTVDAVARENGSVFDSLPEQGIAVFPGDDSYTSLWKTMAGRRRLFLFGFDPAFEVYADAIHVQPDRTEFSLHLSGTQSLVNLRAPGQHNLRNALAAAACASAAGVSPAIIVRGLEAFNPVSGRMQTQHLEGGTILVDDTYNANPDSVLAAIDVLSAMQGRRVLVLGNMGEVGVNSEAVHREVGAYAKEKGIDTLLSLGDQAALAAQELGSRGQSFNDINELMTVLKAFLPANVLVKGSRSARMERIVKALENELAPGGHYAA